MQIVFEKHRGRWFKYTRAFHGRQRSVNEVWSGKISRRSRSRFKCTLAGQTRTTMELEFRNGGHLPVSEINVRGKQKFCRYTAYYANFVWETRSRYIDPTERVHLAESPLPVYFDRLNLGTVARQSIWTPDTCTVWRLAKIFEHLWEVFIFWNLYLNEYFAILPTSHRAWNRNL